MVLAVELLEMVDVAKSIAAARGMLQKKRVSDGSPEEPAR
jgi:hypothetical protein